MRPGRGTIPITAAVGVVLGAAYGAALRGWMRFVSDAREFSWSGTLFIVVVFAVLGLIIGVVVAGRRRHWERGLLAARGVGIVASLGCFGGAGILMLPTIVPGGLALGRHDWPRNVRIVLAVVAAAVAGAVVLTLPGLSPARRAASLIAYVALCGIESRGFAVLYEPSLPAGAASRLGRFRRPVLGVAGAVLLVLVVLSMVGV